MAPRGRKRPRSPENSPRTTKADPQVVELNKQIDKLTNLVKAVSSQFDKAKADGDLALVKTLKERQKELKARLASTQKQLQDRLELQAITLDSGAESEQPTPKKAKKTGQKKVTISKDDSSTEVSASDSNDDADGSDGEDQDPPLTSQEMKQFKKTMSKEDYAALKKEQSEKKKRIRMDKKNAKRSGKGKNKMKDEKRCIDDVTSKFLGYRCIEPAAAILRNQSFMAGYLRLNDNHALRNLVVKLIPMVRDFKSWKDDHFDIPDMGSKATYNFEKITSKLRSGEDIPENWRRLATVSTLNPTLTADDPCFSGFSVVSKDRASTFPKAIYTAFIFKVIKYCPEVFTDSVFHGEESEPEDEEVAEKEESLETEKWLFTNAEEFYRAYLLIRYIMEKCLGDKLPHFGSKPPTKVRYLSDEHYANCTGKSNNTLAKAATKADLTKELGLYKMDLTYRANDLLAVFRKGRILKNDEVAKLIKDDDILQTFVKVLEKSFTSGKGKASGKSTREQLSPETIRAFLHMQGEAVDIVHDAFLDEEVNYNPDENVQTEDVSTAERILPEGKTDQFRTTANSSAIETEFFKLCSTLSSATSEVSLYAEAAEMLGLDKDVHKLGEQHNRFYHPDHPEDPSTFVPKPSQVIGTAWALEMEDSPAEGGVSSLGCGMGKTSKFLMLIYCSAMRELNRYIRYTDACMKAELAGLPMPPKQTFDFRMTAVMGPRATLDSWYTEWIKHWHGANGTPILEMMVHYGVEGAMSPDMDERLLDITLSDDMDKCLDQLNKWAPRDDPRSLFKFVWNSYDTNQSRTLTKSTQEELNNTLSKFPEANESSANEYGHALPSLAKILTKDKELHVVETIYDEIETKRQALDTFAQVHPDEDDVLDDEVYAEAPIEEAIEKDKKGRRMVRNSHFVGLFKRVVCDEGHKLKNCRTLVSKAIDKFYARKKWIVTATPMMNRVSDMLGYFYLFWQPEWLSDLDALDGYTLPANPERHFKPEHIDHFETQCPNYMAKYKGWPMFLFNPHTFAQLVNKGAMNRGTTARNVLTQLLGRIQLRWTMGSLIKLDNKGLYYHPGAEVPLYRIAGVEVRNSDWEKGELQTIWKYYHKHLGSGGNSDRGSSSTKPNISQPGTRDMAVHRMMCLMTFDQKLCKMIIRELLGGVQQVQEWTDDADDKGFSTYFHMTKPTPVTPPYVERLGVCGWMASESIKLRYASKHMEWAMYGDEAGQFKGKTIFYVNWPHTQWDVISYMYNLGLPFYTLWPNTTEKDKAAILRAWNDPNDEVLFLILNARSSSQSLNLQGACHKIVILEMPDSVPLFMQIVGRVHRIGQKEIQFIWLLCVLESYDQWVFANATAKMLAQIAGDADFDAVDVTAEERHAMLTAVKDLSTDDAFVLVQDNQNTKLLNQIEEIIRKMLGSRCSRLEWRDTDLSAPFTDPNGAHAQTERKRHDPHHIVVAGKKRQPIQYLDEEHAPKEPATPIRRRRAMPPITPAQLRRGRVVPYAPDEVDWDHYSMKVFRKSDLSTLDHITTWPERLIKTGPLTERWVVEPDTGCLYDPLRSIWHVETETGLKVIDPVCYVPGIDYHHDDVTLLKIRDSHLALYRDVSDDTSDGTYTDNPIDSDSDSGSDSGSDGDSDSDSDSDSEVVDMDSIPVTEKELDTILEELPVIDRYDLDSDGETLVPRARPRRLRSGKFSSDPVGSSPLADRGRRRGSPPPVRPEHLAQYTAGDVALLEAMGQLPAGTKEKHEMYLQRLKNSKVDAPPGPPMAETGAVKSESAPNGNDKTPEPVDPSQEQQNGVNVQDPDVPMHDRVDIGEEDEYEVNSQEEVEDPDALESAEELESPKSPKSQGRLADDESLFGSDSDEQN